MLLFVLHARVVNRLGQDEARIGFGNPERVREQPPALLFSVLRAGQAVDHGRMQMYDVGERHELMQRRFDRRTARGGIGDREGHEFRHHRFALDVVRVAGEGEYLADRLTLHPDEIGFPDLREGDAARLHIEIFFVLVRSVSAAGQNEGGVGAVTVGEVANRGE